MTFLPAFSLALGCVLGYVGWLIRRQLAFLEQLRQRNEVSRSQCELLELRLRVLEANYHQLSLDLNGWEERRRAVLGAMADDESWQSQEGSHDPARFDKIDITVASRSRTRFERV